MSIETEDAAANDRDIQAELDRPGAGIPWLEMQFGKFGLRLLASRTSRDAALEGYVRSAEQVLRLVGDLDEAHGKKRVLVPRMRFMEDSSRYWSPYMIVEHLCLIDGPLLALVRLLSTGRTSDRVASTAAVKPSPEAGPESLEKFRGIVADWNSQLPTAEKLLDSALHPHPWFGPMNAHQWLCLAAQHHGVHRKQLDAVLAPTSGKS
ncbi:hypothetical protein [Luteolibacter sp. Populi]|uniref:DinB family protein n=1 Tax=Luteolibacter sp. Populi TaxID=3230487 RepID=UPI003465C832